MRFSRVTRRGALGILFLAGVACGQPAGSDENIRVFSGALAQLVRIIDPPTNQAPRTFTATLKLSKAGGLKRDLLGSKLEVVFQAPDHLKLASEYEGHRYVACRDGQELWAHVPDKQFGVIGSPEVAPFATNPERKDSTPLGPLRLPVRPEQVLVLPFAVDLQAFPEEQVGGVPCHVVKATPRPEAIRGFKLPDASLQFWVRTNDLFPLKVAYRDHKGADVEIEILEPRFVPAWDESNWKLQAGPGDRVERVARSHLARFLSVALGQLNERIPPLGPATGERRVVAREGKGRLEMIDGTRVLFLSGTPAEMGREQGILLKKEIRDLVDHILYGVGVGSSFLQGRWFFAEIERAQQRLAPFMDERFLREMDALASASGLQTEEVRLANVFPELFHCSGFALFGRATAGGRMYHGRVLDYMRGMGMEQNAVLMVVKPDRGNGWANVSYAGFIGTVTAMNEKQVAIGEMGGRGEGQWDGKPMAQLLREVMEKADTLEEGVEILRQGPRTCEYYYVISDAKTRRALGIAATPSKFETVQPGQAHPLLPHAIEDAVLMSAGDRYEELARRVKAGFGKFDASSARDLMTRPVAMTSNLHCALFAPDTLDLWVANADSRNVAAAARYTHYNLGELLREEKAP